MEINPDNIRIEDLLGVLLDDPSKSTKNIYKELENSLEALL